MYLLVIEVVNHLWFTGIDEHFLVPNTPAWLKAMVYWLSSPLNCNLFLLALWCTCMGQTASPSKHSTTWSHDD
jgi:hypothetical protein